MKADEVIPFLLAEASRGPELWHQRSYLARVVSIDPSSGIADEGIQPLANFVDDERGGDGVAITLESNGRDDPYPTVYIRRRGQAPRERTLRPDPLLDFEGPAYQRELAAALEPILDQALTRVGQ